MTHCHAHTVHMTWRRRWTTYVTALTGACFALLTQGGYANPITPPPVPTELGVPAGHRPFLMGYATGTQNYICLPKTAAPGGVWTLFGPQATLFDHGDQQITTHFLSSNPDEGGVARATWQHSRDTTTTWAVRIASSADPKIVEPGAIPWLLLEVVGAERGPTGEGRLTASTYLQRVHTSGGLAPATGCDQTDDVGEQTLVPYTAVYVFYKATGRQ